jgi:hypothetical protein
MDKQNTGCRIIVAILIAVVGAGMLATPLMPLGAILILIAAELVR